MKFQNPYAKGNAIAFCILFINLTAIAQINGTKTIPGDYATISAAVTALNTSGVGSGGVTFNIAANYTETISATISLTATGTSANPIVFQKDPVANGANPLLTSYTGGVGTPATAVQDGIWRLVGSDYVTINGIDLKENSANTGNPATMEYGYALYKASTTNGCQYVTIKNCTISLSNINNATGTAPMTDGSAGIIVMNALPAAAITALSPSTVDGTNSYNKFYKNTIQNCNTGISLIGYAASSPFTLADDFNDVGGNSIATGNTIVNYGGAAGATNPAVAIRTSAQYDLNVSYNSINNNNGAGTNHPNTLRGIYINTAKSANVTVTNNTITVNGGGTTQNIIGIDNASGSTAAGNTVTIANNTISNSTYTTATTGGFYGINNSGTPSVLNVTNNIISNNTNSAVTTGFLYGIYNSGAAATVFISNNTVTGNATTALTTGVFSGIYNSGSCTRLMVDSNTIAGSTTTSLSGPYYAIYNTGTVTTAININNNNIGTNTSNAITYNAASSGSLIGIYVTKGGTTAALSISNNNFQGINYAVAGTGSNTYISNSAATLSQAINNNTFTNLNVNTTGSITFLSNGVIVSSAGTQNVNNNSITGTFTKAAAGGTVTLFTSTASSLAGAVINNNNNNFSNITVTGGTTIAGWVNTDAGASTKTIQNNTFYNWSGGTGSVTGMSANITGTGNSITGNTISNITSSGAITGLSTSTGNNNVYSNSIDSLTTNGASVVTGIAIPGGTNNKVFKNKIYDLQASITGGTVNGILISGTSIVAATVYNNQIANLRTPASSAADPIRGISITAASANSTINVYYNTIYLNASSTGTNFGTTGIYHAASATATTAALNLRNNIICNTSTPNGTGLIVALRRSSSLLTNYASASNNNLLYAGSAGSTRLIFYDGTNADQTLASYKTRVATRDAQTVTEDISSKFLSTNGASSNFLHLDASKATLAESGGSSITNYTDDADGQTRYGNTGYAGSGTATDIGADEFDGTKSAAMSGTYYVGTGQTFTSLTKVGGLFASINSLGLSGDVTVYITSDLSEDGANTLYKWNETGAGNYALTIQPDASSLRTISGDVVNGLIRFNNAGNITIDGSNGTANNYLTFRNTNAAGTTGTAFTFINGASGNTITNCNIEAYANATNGTILFSTSTVAGGNSDNTISNCNINATVNSNTGNVCIYSAGTVGNENNSNTISNNTIYNYRDRAVDITSAGSTAWTISGNSIYNGTVTGSISYAASTTLHGIRILGGSGYTISNNYIGGSAAMATGSNAVYSSTLGIMSYQGILLTSNSANAASYIKGNKIAGISVSAVPTSTTAANVFIGIETNGSGITIGGANSGEGNTIGSNTNNSSITVTTSTTTATKKSLIIGINCLSTGGAVTGNQVSSIDITNIGTAPAPSTFTGILVNNATPPSQVTNNIIGSTGSGAITNNIRVLSTSTATTTALIGISAGALINSTLQISGNIIQNISHQSATASGTFTGINNAAISPAVITITGNTITGNANNATAGVFYGIYSNAASSSIAITSNVISNDTSTATGAGALYGIYTASTPSSIAINSNTFSGNITGALTTGLFVGIYNAATPATLTINNNSFYGNATTAVSGVHYSIYNSGAVSSTININGNIIGTSTSNAITYNAANSGSQVFIYNAGGTAAAALSISSNTFQGINYATAGTGNNTYILNSAATLSQAINGNTFTNLNVNTSGNITFISDNVIVAATGTQNVNNNSISGTFTKKAGGTVTLFTSTASSVAGAVINNNTNNFSNITVTGATAIAGWINTDAGAGTKTIQNNTFSTWSGGTSSVTALSVNITATGNAVTGNAINNITSGAAITGIATAAGNDNIYLNTINALSTTGASAVSAIAITAGTTKNIYKNKIYDIGGTNASSTVNGILVSGGTTVNIYNNLLGNLTAGAANSTTDVIRGISVTSTTATSNVNVYYNTIYINATSTGTNFSSSGIYHTTSATATTAALDLRNNIVMNTSTPKGTGITAAYRRSSAALTNFASTANNNLFYAGTPATNKLIYYDGTNSDQALTAYKTRVSTRESSSVTEDLSSKFLSTTGSSSVFLHINNSLSTQIESGGANVTGFTDDVDGQIRAGNTGYVGSSSSPDIGADEIFGLETTPPSISYTALSNTTSTVNRSITGITITDGSGVNNNAGTKPRIYYKRYSDANTFVDNTASTNGWKYTEATNTSSPYTFTINYSLLYGGSSATVGAIQYFVVAQDIATTANVGINSGTFTVTPASVALTASAFPITGTVNNYNIPFSGTYNIGNTEVFKSLTKTDGLFAAINSVGLIGNTTITITSDLSEDGTIALNQWVESGTGNYTLTVQPDAATMRTVSGSAATGLIRLDGSDRVTFDGSNGGSGSYLSFKNTNTSGTTGTAFTFINGATNNTIKYCDAEAYADATDGVILFGTTGSVGNSNNLIDNCTVNATINSNTGTVAIYSSGTAGNENSSNTISNNTIYNYKQRAIDIAATGSTAWTISNNSFYNGTISGSINYAANTALQGIRIAGGSGYSILNNYIGGNSALASGTNATYASTLGSISYTGISLTTNNASPASYIKGNIIKKISLSTIPTAAGTGIFTGIETYGSGINIGGTADGDGNRIGSLTQNGSITVATSTTAATNTSFIRGINCQSNNGSIDGNQVTGVDISNTGTSPAASAFQGIYVNAAAAPSEINNNTIGSTTKLNSIRVLSTSTAAATSLTGIVLGSAVSSTVQVNSNAIENISNLSTTSSGSFTGIYNGASSGAAVTISSDTIQNINSVNNSNVGSTMYAGIVSASTSAITNNIINSITLASIGNNAQLIGIDVAGAYTHTISGNTITTLSTPSTKTVSSIELSSPATATIIGILNEATAANQVISNNIISGLYSTTISALNTSVVGMGITATASGTIYKNRLANLSNTSTGSAPGICGITAFDGSFTAYNNVINLANTSNIDNATNSNGVKLYGVNHATSNNWNYYHNTIRISGNATGTAQRSAAFIRSVAGTVTLRNNVLVNKRNGTGKQYAISNITSPAASSWSASGSNYNDLYSNNAGNIAEWGSGVNNSFAQWQTNSGGDANSVNRNVSFVSATYDLQPDSTTNCSLSNTGIAITNPVINTDINDNSRNTTNPDLGAYEFNYTGFSVTADNSSPVCSGSTISFTVDADDAENPTYQWTNPSHAVIATTQNPGIAISTAGSYTIKVTDIFGCSDSASTVVSLNATPTATISGTASICNGSNATITLTVTGTGTIDGTLNNGDAFSGTAPTITVVESPSANTTYTIATMSDSTCTSKTSDLKDSAVITVNTGIWTGAVSTDWNDASNWCGGMPTATTDATISSGLLNYPVVSSVDSVRNITIASNASLSIIAAGSFAITGQINDQGTLSNNGSIILKGTAVQRFPDSNATVSAMNNLIINNPAGVTINKSFTLTGTLTSTAGTLDLADKNITLQSDSSNTARVAPVSGAFAYSGGGKFIVQRYLPAHRAWRLLTAPVTASTTIFNSWQNGGVYTPGKGTLITGASPGVANGLDASPSNSVSLKAFNLASQSLTTVTNTKTSISPGNTGNADNAGYFIFIRGDRDPATTNNPNFGHTPVNSTVLSAAGRLQTGNQTFTASATAGGFTLIGNPYASPIDFNNVSLTNVAKRFYVWDPTLNLVGAYVLLDDIDEDGVFNSSVLGSHQGKEIQSGQAFFVQTLSAGNASVLINENSKSTINNKLVFRPASVTQSIHIVLNLLNDDSSIILADGTMAQFSTKFTNTITVADAVKLANVNESISFVEQGKKLAIERRAPAVANDTLLLNLANTTKRNYQLSVSSDNFTASDFSAYLLDNYTGTKTPLSYTGPVTINFSIDSNSSSQAANRFQIIFNGDNALPVTFTSVKAGKQQNKAAVQWNVENQTNIKEYIVERSADGKNFSQAAIVNANTNSSTTSYNWTDDASITGDSYYRIISVDLDGTTQNSQVVKVNFAAAVTATISVAHNPVINGSIELLFSNSTAGQYTLNVYTPIGQLIQTNALNCTATNTKLDVPLSKQLSAGVYYLEVMDAKGAYGKIALEIR
ncbi:hypothetical protein [Ferruginibacter albus]|uniref:hypothetical protein n=1 Tax=Ferruginibacter albus TaxID=2875540 RepID=UPI001CC7CAD7|nr:hypothetical protein [Ferruginibacter albus]UAY51277.1 hypothetical protein K9M53_11830 [Ferruginibacter albus]